MSEPAIPSYVAAMVRRPQPKDACIVPGSTPVVSFGDPSRCSVATLGINPSSAEFTKKGVLLTGDNRRLETLLSLGASRTEDLSDAQVAAVIAGCNGYFQRNPYRKWFDPLDEILRGGLNVSYYDGTAAHLDLVQWATDPVWGKIPNPEARSQLLDEGVHFLRQQLERENINTVVANGRQVWDQLIALRMVRIVSEEELRYGASNKATKVRVAEGCGARFLGWSCNVQAYGSGVRRKDLPLFARWLCDAAEAPSRRPEAQALPITQGEEPMSHSDTGGEHLERTVVQSKSELVALLKRWLRNSSAGTIGAVGTYGGSWLIRVDLGGGQSVSLNADTKRAAVDAFVEAAASRGPDMPWRVLPNKNGIFNKVDFAISGEPVPGWYCYLSPAAGGEGSL